MTIRVEITQPSGDVLTVGANEIATALTDLFKIGLEELELVIRWRRDEPA